MCVSPDLSSDESLSCSILPLEDCDEAFDLIRNRGHIRNHRWRWKNAQRTMDLMRFHAAEWHIDPHKIGVLGFSAGGHLSAAISTHFAKRLCPVVDAADKESCRPDFAVAIYPGHLSIAVAEWDAKQGTKKFVVRHPATAGKDFGLNPDVPVTSQTPPTFLLQAEDDHVDNVGDSLAYYIALNKAGVPVET